MTEQTPTPETPKRSSSAPRLRDGKRLRGANVHHRTSVFVQRVELGGLDDLAASDVGSDFGSRFVARFADLQPLRVWPGLPPDLITALEGRRDVPLVEVLLQAILAVERSVACIMRRMDPPEFAAIERSASAPGAVDLVWESHSAALSRAAVKVAFVGLMELLPPDRGGKSASRTRDFATRWESLRRRAIRRQWSPTTAVLALAARRRGIPYEVLAGSYVRLGEGVLQQVVSESALGVESRMERPAVPAVRTPPPWWKFGRQRLHRLLVLGGRVVSAVRIDSPVITGDGESSIAQLLAFANTRPQRDRFGRALIALDEPLRAYLGKHGLNPEDVLARGEKITLECVTAIEGGAVPVDVTARMHEDVRHAAAAAAAERGRPNAVVDFRTANIARSSKRGRGRVTRIDPWPDLLPHALPNLERSAVVGDAALDLVLPAETTGRIPTVLVVGERGTMALAQSFDRYLRGARAGVGLALRDRTTIEGRPVDRTLLGRQGGVEFLLRDPRVTSVISAVSPRKILARGLRFAHCNVIAFLDPEPGSDPEAYRTALEVGLATATDAVVIGADNPHVEHVLANIEPARVLLVATRKRHPVVARHLAAKGAAVMPTPGSKVETIELRWAGRAVAMVPLGSLRQAKKAPSERALRRALFAAALGFGLAPALPERAPERAAAAPRPEMRQGADPIAERSPYGVGSPGTLHASRPGGSYPSADGGLDAPYRNHR